jgi:hypothetical protein
VDGGAIVFNGDVNECPCSPAPCTCPDPGQGSVYHSITPRFGFVINGPAGRHTSSTYGKIHSKPPERESNHPSVYMRNGKFTSSVAQHDYMKQLIAMKKERTKEYESKSKQGKKTF